MLAAGIKEGDEVLTTPFSFVASTNCILYVGARPTFADIDLKTLNLDIDKAAAAITPKTRAMVVVEAFGHPGGMPELEQLAQKHELILIEDCCEGFGGRFGQRRIGSFGRAGVFGFYPNKQITTGEGGMIVTDDNVFADTCRSLRNQGRDSLAWLAHRRLGYNYRLSEINAAIGIVQCKRLDEILEDRRRVAQAYMERLMTNRYLILPTLTEETFMSWFVFVVRLNDLFTPWTATGSSRNFAPPASDAATISRRFICSRTWSSDSAMPKAPFPSVNTSRPGHWRCRSTAS